METVIHVGRDPVEARTLSALLAGLYAVLAFEDEAGAREAARESPHAAVVVDLDEGPEEGLRFVGLLAREGRRVIALSREESVRSAVLAVRSGAAEFLRKPYSAEELRRSIAGSGTSLASSGASGPFLGTSAAIRKVAERLRLFAGSDYPVLILGESGTGKEIAARALHERSSRASGPFIAKNCAALPELLAESELFGTERGAFTDALSRPGAFELARGGVLFLDEIAEAGPGIQAKLLRALETGEFWRLGAAKPTWSDLRFVSATCVDLGIAVARGTFRPELLYRIDTLVLELPPLRERREDIPDLATHFALSASGGRTLPGAEALEKLSAYPWPGNIRQLRNVVHRALVLSEGAEELGEEHIVF